ncbi:MAG: vWA domain-containing protein [Bacteroidota bacterium]
MTFVYPLFLWALAALSIPILIHLFNFRRTVRVFFSNTRFLKQVKEVTTAKRRLKHYLILASRLLFLFFLIIAFAQPIIPAREQLNANHQVALYIDNSQSMSAQLPDQSRGIDAALNFAQHVVNLFPPDTRYRIITNDFAPYSNSYKTKSEAMDLLTQIRVSPVSRSMQEIKDRLSQLQTSRSSEVFWISDLQKSTLGTIPLNWDSALRWHLVPVRFGSAANVFVDSAYLENPFATSGEKNVLRLRMRNDGKEEVDQLIVKLTINNIQAGTAAVNIPPGGLAETSFDLTTGLAGLNRAVITFNDFPISFDNEFYLALNFSNKVNVLEIKRAAAPTPIERVFGNQEVFDFKAFSESNFNYSLLSQADLVVVNGLDQIQPSLVLSLRNFIDQDGTLLLIPGSHPNAASYQPLAGTKALKVMAEPGELTELDRPDFGNPFFENVFEERSVSMAMPRAVKLLDWGTDRSALLRFKNEQPFLSRFDRPGKLYLMASPLEAGFTDFFNHGLFVPVMYRMASSGKKTDFRPYHTLKETFIALRIDSLRGDEPLRLKGEQEIVPSQRQVSNLVLMDIPKFSLNQGFYKVVANRDTVSLIAFNLDKAESLMDQYSGSDVKMHMGNGDNITIFEANTPEAFSNEIKARYLGKPLWKYALMLALVFLLAEVLLIRFLK